LCRSTTSPGAMIGGSAAGAGNVISGNHYGIWIFFNSPEDVVQGNLIGINAAGTGPLGNDVAIELDGSDGTIGGTSPGEGNVIAYNGSGILLEGSASNSRIRGNSMHDDAGLGIDLGDDGQPNFNDPLDADAGANQGQNYPIVQTVTLLAPQSGTRIQGKLNSTPSTTFDLDFYANAACSNFPRELLEG